MKKIDIRHQQIRLRKNFFPTLIITVFLWLLVGLIVYFVNPGNGGVIILFFFLIFLSTLFTFSTLFANSRRGLITSIVLSIFLVLRYLGVRNILNLFLLAGLSIATEFYLSKK